MKKVILAGLTAICALGCACGLIACKDSEPRLVGMLIQEAGGEPTSGDLHLDDLVYGDTPVLDYKLYLNYSDGSKKEVTTADKKLSVEYYFNDFYKPDREKINALPDKYVAGAYYIEYKYDGREDVTQTVTINVARVENGAFSVEFAETEWFYGADSYPAINVKNPNGDVVQKNTSEDATYFLANDTVGNYRIFAIQKSAYDGLTIEQKADHDAMFDFIVEHMSATDGEVDEIGSEGLSAIPVGEYVFFAEVNTHNYVNGMGFSAPVTVKHPIIERTFTFQSIKLYYNGQEITEETADEHDAEWLYITENMREANLGATVICKANGKVRGTADFGAGVFDAMPENEAYGYSCTIYDEGTSLSIKDPSTDTFLGTGMLVGKTLTLTVNIYGAYTWDIIFTC